MARRLSHASLPRHASERPRGLAGGSACSTLAGGSACSTMHKAKPYATMHKAKPYATLIDRRAEVALGERGLRFQRLAPAGAGFFRLAVGFQNAAQIEQRLGHVGYLRKGIAILADRLVELARFFVHQAGVVEHLRRALAQIDQARVELQRGIEIVGLNG